MDFFVARAVLLVLSGELESERLSLFEALTITLSDYFRLENQQQWGPNEELRSSSGWRRFEIVLLAFFHSANQSSSLTHASAKECLSLILPTVIHQGPTDAKQRFLGTTTTDNQTFSNGTKSCSVTGSLNNDCGRKTKAKGS